MMTISQMGNISTFSEWWPPPCWIFKILKFYWLEGSRGSDCIIMPNFVAIHQTIAAICRVFQTGGRRHFGLSKFQNF